ncbi:beta-ketoacyl synthase N-terminal-like domain-containing protein [Pareuzebyella sediminis]|uniref:beta-ketoacyl synthase N-terminal-like domain-containing protein n=1 Tax=Pareuzebyella sediminis TaxID=2607998 RepID=UPI0018E0D2A4|nr:beta-ketoacyl synthase N-terminal-like domain-containing protein [Pareuzebyella sediminis]
MLKESISITSMASISSLGSSSDAIWDSYKNKRHFLGKRQFGKDEEWAATFQEAVQKEMHLLRNSEDKYQDLDPSVLYALNVSRKAIESSAWEPNSNFGINIGSSRGATALFEKYHEAFLKNNRAATLTSPTTTLGNISSWVAHDLNCRGPEISHSITCSTALHALLNGVAWIQSGMVDKFLVGGSEAPLTPFTIAQMRALKIYADKPNENIESDASQKYPCLALDLTKKRNSMVLGEGAAVVCLEKGLQEKALALIEGVGYATEPLQHNISISADALCFQRSMRMALGSTDPSEVDVIVMHAPGTIKGDMSEYRAIEKVFGPRIPALTTNKWKLGHTFGASGMLSLELAVLMLQHQEFVPVPYVAPTGAPEKLSKVMVNAVGFGGNAVTVLLSTMPSYS